MRQAWLSLDDLIAADPVRGAYFNPRALGASGRPLFRMLLWRIWDKQLPILSVGCLNPSIAGAEDDPTTTRIVGFAEAHGYGGYYLWNRYAYIATKPLDLIAFGSISAIGPDNDHWIRTAIEGRDVLVAWGANWVAEDRLVEIEGLLLNHILSKRAYCLGYTKDGYPKHPLYLPSETKFEPWEAARRQRRT